MVRLWVVVFDTDDAGPAALWRRRAHEWFSESLEARTTVRVPVVETDGDVVATAVGTLEVGVPNPHCPRGRTVRLANVYTVPAHRRRGLGTVLVEDVVGWATSIGADRVDLSATPDGRRLYERAGFVLTSAPRMKLVLPAHE